MWRAHALAMFSLRNSAWHHMRNIALADRCFGRTIGQSRVQERENITKRQMNLQKDSHIKEFEEEERQMKSGGKSIMRWSVTAGWWEIQKINKTDEGALITTSGCTWDTSVTETVNQRWLRTDCLHGGQGSSKRMNAKMREWGKETSEKVSFSNLKYFLEPELSSLWILSSKYTAIFLSNEFMFMHYVPSLPSPPGLRCPERTFITMLRWWKKEVNINVRFRTELRGKIKWALFLFTHSSGPQGGCSEKLRFLWNVSFELPL